MIKAKRYQAEDLPRLQAALAEWIKEAGDCGYCHSQEVARRIHKDANQAPPPHQRVTVWEVHGDVVAFAIHLRFENDFEVYSRPDMRGSDAEREMLQSALTITRQRMETLGRDPSEIIMDVWECDPVRQQQLAQLGFGEYRVWGQDQTRSLEGVLPDVNVPPGYTIRQARLTDAPALAEAYGLAFGTQVSAEDYREGIMAAPGYAVEREWLVSNQVGVVAALTTLWLDSVNKVGQFEPVATHPDHQRRGLARALMAHCLHWMRDQEMAWAAVGHDADNTAARQLYQGLGFWHKHTTLGYRQRKS